MRSDAVLFRGTKQGLLIIIDEEAAFSTVRTRLAEKLTASGDFFKGAEVTVNVGQRVLSAEERAELGELLGEWHGLTLKEVVQGTAPSVAVQPAPRERLGRTNPWSLVDSPLVVNRTVRSGQSIRYYGDVIILGDVNAGAEVVASGHILVMGALRGVAHAGATGNTGAVVVAARLRPTQLRIGTYISRPPDGDEVGGGDTPELARVHDGMIVIESGSLQNA